MLKRSLCYLAAVLCLTMPAYGLVEVCGNGVDDDSSGGDEACPSPDADSDGYTTDGTLLGFDCDDTNRRIGVGTEITTGCSAGQFKTCQSNGTYTACGAATGTSYHIDPVGGSNFNNGTSYATAFADWSCVSRYASGAPGCNVHATLNCGDHIYLYPGTHSQQHSDDGSNVGLKLVKACTLLTPVTVHFIGAAVADLVTTAGSPATPIWLGSGIATGGIVIKGNTGGEITGTNIGSRGAIYGETLDGVDISGLKIHDNGSDGDNNGGNTHFAAGS